MVRSELAQKLCNAHPQILRKDMEKILDIIFYEITEALNRGENIEIHGFGSYKIKSREARMGRNPKSSEIIQIPAKKTVRWKMSKVLYSRLNKNFTENKIGE